MTPTKVGRKRRPPSVPSVYETEVLEAFLEKHEKKASRAVDIQYRVWRRKDETSHGLNWLKDEPDLPKEAMGCLSNEFVAVSTKVTKKTVSSDGSTVKLLLQLHDGLHVESVIMKYEPWKGKNATEPDSTRRGMPRTTLCVSSQVGCQMGCRFCATGRMGMLGDLTVGEILEQVHHASRISDIRNVVFMGMGEPLNNYKNVIKASKSMRSAKLFRIRRLTISTVGISGRIRQLPTDLPECRLALSLHAPTQEKRLQIVPSAKAFPLDKLMQAVYDFLQVARHPSIFVEYVLLKGINDSQEDAHELGRLLQGRPFIVNLIPYNPAYAQEGSESFQPPLAEETRVFQVCLRQVYGLRTTVRQEMGQDINGACGQLANIELADIEDTACGQRASGYTSPIIKLAKKLQARFKSV